MLFLSHLQDAWMHNVPTSMNKKGILIRSLDMHAFTFKYLMLETFWKDLQTMYPYLHNTSSTLFCFFLKLQQTRFFDRWYSLGSATEIVPYHLPLVPALFCAPLLPNTALVGTHLRTHSNTMMIPTTKLGLSVQGDLSMDTILPCISWQVVTQFETRMVKISLMFSDTDVWKGYQSHLYATYRLYVPKHVHVVHS